MNIYNKLFKVDKGYDVIHLYFTEDTLYVFVLSRPFTTALPGIASFKKPNWNYGSWKRNLISYLKTGTDDNQNFKYDETPLETFLTNPNEALREFAKRKLRGKNVDDLISYFFKF